MRVLIHQAMAPIIIVAACLIMTNGLFFSAKLNAQDSNASINLGTVNLLAKLTETSAVIKEGLVWRVFEAQAKQGATPNLVERSSANAPQLRLPQGEYLVNVAYGQAYVTKKIIIKGHETTTEALVLNAGGVRISSAHANGKLIDLNNVTYDIFTSERDQYGKRKLTLGNVRPGVTVRLNAGLYHIVSTYGDSNASTHDDIAIEAGLITDISVNHDAANVTFKLVNEPNGEALANTQWRLFNSKAKLIKKSVGALPTHILAAGTYYVKAIRQGQTYQKKFAVKAGDTKKIEILAANSN